jgi:hypothetical protein
MKINELINEAMPYGFGSYLKNQIRSNIPFGAKGQAQAMGKNQAGMMANQEFQRFHQWLGSFNGQATMPNLVHFLKARRFKTDGVEEKNKALPQDRPLDDKQVGQIIQDVIQTKIAPAAPTTPPAQPAPTNPVPTVSPSTTPAPVTPPTTAPSTPPTTAPSTTPTTAPSTTPKPKYKMGPDGKPIPIT